MEEEPTECYICTQQFNLAPRSGTWNDDPICPSCVYDIEQVRKQMIKDSQT